MIVIRVVILICSFMSTAWAEQASVARSPHVRVSLESEQTVVGVGTNWFGVRFVLDPGWHVYWRNPGDSGAAPKLSFSLPAGAMASELQWPVPSRIQVAHLVNYGYEGAVVLLLPVEVKPEFSEALFTISVVGEWLICKEDCIPGEGRMTLTREVDLGRKPTPTDEYEDLRSRLPTPRLGDPLSFELFPSHLLVHVPDDQRTLAPLLLPFAKGIIRNAALPLRNAPSTLTLSREVPGTVPDQFEALLIGSRAEQVTLARSQGTAPSNPIGEPGSSLLVLTILAFLGGLLLNLMPCVLPVIGLKVLGLVEHATHSRSARAAYGALFLLGVLLSMWGVWGFVLVARSVGLELGWGFQLQEPTFVAVLALILMLLSLNLLGVFELGATLQRLCGNVRGRTPRVEALLSGFLTTVVATPCTAPFMGSSVAYAFTAHWLPSLVIFTSLGIGLGLPYLLLSSYPSLARILPRPGEWMVTLKQVMAFPLFATVVWLCWVYGLQLGVDSLTRLLFSLLCVSLVAWILGRFAHPGRGPVARRAAQAGALAVLVVSVLFATSTPTAPAVGSSPVEDPFVYRDQFGQSWERFSEARLTEHKRAGRTVFVDFTAAWCVTCQVNKRVVFGSEEVRQRIIERDVVLMRADWTKRDSEIERALAARGKVGVPLNIVYFGEDRMNVLPTVLTPGIVLDALER